MELKVLNFLGDHLASVISGAISLVLIIFLVWLRRTKEGFWHGKCRQVVYNGNA